MFPDIGRPAAQPSVSALGAPDSVQSWLEMAVGVLGDAPVERQRTIVLIVGRLTMPRVATNLRGQSHFIQAHYTGN